MTASHPINMLFIGEPLKEYVATRVDEKTVKDEEEVGYAGDVAPNMASYAVMAAKAYNVPVNIDVLTALGPVGDPFSDAAVADLEARGAHLHPASKRIEDKTIGTVTNLKNEDGTPAEEKVRMNRKDSAFRDLLNGASDDDLRDMVKGYSHLVVSGIPLACVRERDNLVKLISYAKKQNPPCKIIVSTNLRPSNWQMPDRENPEGIEDADDAWKEKARSELDKIIPMADILFANAGDEKKVRGSETTQEAAEKLRALNPTAEIVVTNDEHPVRLSFYEDGKKRAVSIQTAELPDKLVDTVGAGDSLAATYVIAREAGCNPRSAAKLGSLVAAQVVCFKGALPKVDKPLNFNLRGVGLDKRELNQGFCVG